MKNKSVRHPAIPHALAVIDASDCYSKLTSGILEIHFAKNGLRQIDAVNAPAPLRRDVRRSIVEVLIICLQETVINFIQSIVEHLLGIRPSLRKWKVYNRIRKLTKLVRQTTPMPLGGNRHKAGCTSGCIKPRLQKHKLRFRAIPRAENKAKDIISCHGLRTLVF